MSNMNRLDSNRRALVIKCLAEGNSLRATSRLTGVARMTVEKLLRDAALACHDYHDAHVRNLQTVRVQADEIWAFCYAKVRTVRKDPSIKERNKDAGDVWTWTAIDADSKLMISYLVGARTADNAYGLLADLKSRLTQRIQLTTDQLTVYMRSADRAFGIDVDYAMIHKIYANNSDGGRYSPPECIGTRKVTMTGSPDPKHISTSYVERSNLTMRMQIRRFTRLTNAFSKKIEMHFAAVALHFFYYNFCQIHGTLRVTPAMAAGIETRVWDAEDIVKLLDHSESGGAS
jgi:IS1 family transposase